MRKTRLPDAQVALEAMASSLARDPRLTFIGPSPTLAFGEGVLAVDGEVADVKTKKLLLERLAASQGVELVDDRVRVAPAESMGDAEIRDRLLAALAGDSTFDECAIEVVDAGAARRVREARADGTEKGAIRIGVTSGVVTLEGVVPSRNHARLAAALAWWIPGSRDVKDLLGPRFHEEFDELDLVEGVRIVLEKDPLVDAGQIRVSAEGTSVTLAGTVAGALERDAAVRDAWFVPDVSNVIDDLAILH